VQKLRISDCDDFASIHLGQRYIVHRCRNSRDGRRVIVKTVRQGPRADGAAADLHREYDILCALSQVPVRVSRPIAMEERPDGPALVLEDAGPENLLARLKHQPMSIDESLPVAVALARIVAGLHEHQVLHRDINPSNVVIDGQGLPTLVDFDAATRIIGASAGSAQPDLRGNLLYLAPEQTGRMSRGVDHRADLYALGATLYELLTGSPPFVSADPVQLVHAHLAKSPVAPTSVVPDVPHALSEIVLKLLSKMPEHRYQSADGLRMDLEKALEQWRSSRTIATFDLGRGDLTRSLGLSDQLHGRAPQLDQLTEALTRATEGTTEIVAVSGPAGIGKSALVAELATMARSRARVVVGRAGQVAGDVPYAAWVDAFRPLLREIRDGPLQELERWRSQLLAAGGRNLAVLENVLPELARLIGPHEPVPSLGLAESEHRFHLTFCAFLRALAIEFNPLVVVLDDLQWADVESLKLLRAVATGTDSHPLLLVVVYRDEQLRNGGLLAATLEEISTSGTSFRRLELGPLDLEALTELLGEALRTPTETLRPLGRVVLEKTAGNALFVRRFLHTLHERGALRLDLDSGQWRWDVDEIERADATENVVALMSEAIRRLPDDSQRLLRIAACSRRRVDLELLAAVADEDRETVAAHLWVALRDRLLITSEDDAPSVSYQFAHDRVQEAAYALSSQSERNKIHLLIGRALRARSPEEQETNLFELVDQLDFGVEFIDDPGERFELAKLNARAAAKARGASAFAAACRYLQCAITLMDGKRGWQSHRDFMFRLHHDAAQAAYLSGDHPLGNMLVSEALHRASSPFERVEFANVQIVACSTRGELSQAIAWGERGLAALGLELPGDRVTAWSTELAMVEKRLGNRRLETLVALEPMEDRLQLACMELFSNLLSPAYVSDPHLLAFLAGRMVNLTFEHGSSVFSASGYAALGMVVGFLEQDYDTAHTLGRIGVELSRTFDDPVQECRTAHVFGCFVNHWRAPLRTSVPILRRGVARGFEGGEVEFAVYATGTIILLRFHMGDPLGEVAAEIEGSLPVALHAGVKAGVEYELAYLQAIRCLQGRTVEFGSFDDETFDETEHIEGCGGNPLSLSLYYVLRLETCFLARRFEQAEAMSSAAKAALPAVWGIAPLAEHNFFESLTLAATNADDAGPRIRDNQKQLKTWATHCPENYQHKFVLVEAELARVENRELDAAGYYDEAIEAAARESMIQDQAIANELAGRFWWGLGRRRIAGIYVSAALETYARWGASAKVVALEEEFLAIAYDPQSLLRGSGPSEARRSTLDFLAIRKATETISSEVVLERLLDKLLAVSMEIAGGTRAALLLGQHGKLVIRASGPADASADVPRTLVNAAHELGDPIVLGDAAHDPQFGTDAVIRAHQTKSALAVPVRRQGRSIGVLYVENHLVTHAFDRERVWMLTLLSTQIAISLQNSLLFEGLQLEVNERRRAEQSVRFLADAGIALAQSLEEETTVHEAVRLAVPFVADWCMVGIIGETLFDRIVVAHEDPDSRKLLEERPPSPLLADVAKQALESREARRCTLSGPQPEGLPPATRGLLAAPLVARGRDLGVLVLGSSRDPTLSDLVLARELGNRVALAIDNARLYRQAQEAIGMRDEFLSIASHELRTPLTSLRLAAQRLLRAPVAPAAFERTTAIIDRQSKRLSSLVEDLLDVSRIHSGRLHLHLEQVDLGDVIRDVLERFEHHRRQAATRVDLRIESGVNGCWDPSRLDQVITNLLSNALKFGAGHPIEIDLNAADGRARLTVTDHGVGIPPERVPYIFDRFERAVSSSEYGGLGLGLYITKQIVIALGGTIAAHSVVNTGTTICVELPTEGPGQTGPS
jgi:predicted ATPase/signal transduction histidine kinase